MSDSFTIVHMDKMSALECAQYVLGEFGHGGRALAVEDNGNLSVKIKRVAKSPVVCNGAIAVAIKIRLAQEKTK